MGQSWPFTGNQGMESVKSLLGFWGSHGSWNNPTFAAFTPFQTLKIFRKAVPVSHVEQDNKYSVFSPCSQPISGSHISPHFYLSLKTQIKTLMLVFNL